MTDLRNHFGAADLLLNSAGHPTLAADGFAGSWAADNLVAARVARIRNTLLDHWARNCLGVSFPSPAADVDNSSFRHRLHDGVAAVTVTGFRLSAAGCVALISVTGLVARFADCVAARAVAGLEARLAGCVRHVAVTCLVTRFTNLAIDGFVARFENRLIDSALNTAELRFEDRLAHCVALIAVARLVDVSQAGHGHRFGTLIVNDLVCRVLLLIPNNFSYGPVLNTATTLCGSKVAA